MKRTIAIAVFVLAGALARAQDIPTEWQYPSGKRVTVRMERGELHEDDADGTHCAMRHRGDRWVGTCRYLIKPTSAHPMNCTLETEEIVTALTRERVTGTSKSPDWSPLKYGGCPIESSITTKWEIIPANVEPDVVQFPFSSSIFRRAVPACNGGKVNLFLRYRNAPTVRVDRDGKPTGDFRYPVLAGPWVQSLRDELNSAGYCVYFAPIYENPATTEPDSHVRNHANPALAFSPSEVSAELENEPPYVMVTVAPYVFFDGSGESLSFTFRNRWVSYTPEITTELLQPTHLPDRTRVLRDIDWVAHRIPAVKSRIMFEGRELGKGSECKLPDPPTPAEVLATDSNYEKSADAACRVSAMYFDRDGQLNKCAARAKGRVGMAQRAKKDFGTAAEGAK